MHQYKTKYEAVFSKGDFTIICGGFLHPIYQIGFWCGIFMETMPISYRSIHSFHSLHFIAASGKVCALVHTMNYRFHDYGFPLTTDF